MLQDDVGCKQVQLAGDLLPANRTNMLHQFKIFGLYARLTKTTLEKRYLCPQVRVMGETRMDRHMGHS